MGNNEQTLLDTRYAEVIFVPGKKLIRVTWKGEVKSEEYRHTFHKTLECGEKNVVENFISDITRQKIISPEDRKWFETDVLPKAISVGLKRGCVVYDGNIFKKYYLTHIMNSTKDFGLPFKFAGSMDEALNWIESEENQR